MEYSRELHCIECPKCGHGMDEFSCGEDLLIDRCSHCQGLWFDQVEADLCQRKWMTEALEVGRSGQGRKWDVHDHIACPRCGQPMERAADPDQPRIWYEVCQEHGMFMDAGKFTDRKQQTLSDWFVSLIRSAR